MPRSSALARPSPGDPDRKRVLNVLAQRRYRQRQKEKYAALEKQANPGSTSGATSSSPEHISEDGSLTDQPTFQTDGGVPLPDNQVNILDFETGMGSTYGLDLDGQLDLQLASLDAPLYDQSHTYGPNLHPFSTSFELISPHNDGVLETPVLKLMPVIFEFARVLGCQTILFDTDARWTPTTTQYPNLPVNMQPTQAQLTIPHHPFFDLLPWPSLRNKLIGVFALPPEARPPIGRDPMALLQIVYDVDDDTEGFRLNGGGFNRDDWEVGQAFFRNWWWALDRSIVDKSNAWRQSRGMKRLSLKLS